MPANVWTTRRKIMGNFWPALPPLPIFGFAVYRSVTASNWFILENLILFGISAIVAWISVNYLGLTGNRSMRLALWRRFASADSKPGDLGKFVGISSPGYTSIWDPHKDVGFLRMTPGSLVFVGDTMKLDIPRSSIKLIGRASNPHSFLLLGGWITVDGILDGKPFRLMVELRESHSLLGNKKLQAQFQADLQEWLQKR